MDRLVFTANTAMNEHRLDRQSMTHELANVSTIGFKKAYQIANRAVRIEGEGFDTRFAPRAFTTLKIDLSPGPRMVTGRSLDIAMNEKTVLGVRAENGDLAWTRRGDLQVDPEGLLRTGQGHLVLDESGQEIQMPVGSVIYEINEDGSISVMDPAAPEAGSVPMAKLLLKDSSAIDMGRREDGLFRPMIQSEDGQDFETGPETASVSAGILEGSNVSTVYTLVKFIDHMRSFEMQTKIIKEMKDNESSGATKKRVS